MLLLHNPQVMWQKKGTLSKVSSIVSMLSTNMCTCLHGVSSQKCAGVLRLKNGVQAVAAKQQLAADVVIPQTIATYQRINLRNLLMILKVGASVLSGRLRGYVFVYTLSHAQRTHARNTHIFNVRPACSCRAPTRETGCGRTSAQPLPLAPTA